MFPTSDVDFTGFGQSTIAELTELRKALDIGVTQPPTGFDSLRIESLEQTLKLLTFRMDHMRLWQTISKTQAFSTIEEYNRLEQYGAFESGTFNPSGVLPEEQDSTYSRQNQLVKYLGTTRIVTHPATLVRTAPNDLIAQETANGATFLMGKVNQALYYADSAIVPDEFNGLIEQIVSGGGHVVDMRGAGLTQEAIEDGVQLVLDNYGNPQRLFSNNAVFGDFAKQFQSFQRFAAPNVGQGVVGTPATGYASTAGTISFETDRFVTGSQVVPAAETSTRAPDAPTIGTFSVDNAATTTGNSLVSFFVAADIGDFLYQVSAINRFGESLPSAASAAQTIAEAGSSVNFTITDVAGADPSTGYRIYRTGVDGTVTHFMVRVAKAGATTVIVDLNADVPETFAGLMLDMGEQSLTYRQLSPMIRMPLATVAPSIRWMQLIYGTPIVYQPLRNVYFKNIGRVS